MDQHEILARIRAELGPDEQGQFCFVCGAPGLSIQETAEGELFVCHAAGHRSPRAFLFDGRAVFSFEDDKLIHETAGALIRRGDGTNRQTLLFLRRRFPFRYTIPAGHIELGCEPEIEMRREVLEETGLTVQCSVRLWSEEEMLLKDPCRRGADLHSWHVFDVVADGQPRLSDEGRVLGWYSDEEIREFANGDMLTTAVYAIFARLDLLNA